MSPNQSRQPNWRQDVLRAILAVTQRKRLVLIIFLIVLALTALRVATLEPFYRSSATVVLLPREKPILDIASQSDTLESSDESARRASASSLTLPPNPELYDALIRSVDLASQIHNRLGSEELTIRQVRSSLAVESSEEGLLTISCQAGSPWLAKQIVELCIEACEEASKSIERQLMIQQMGFLDGAILNVHGNTESLTAQIDAYAEQFGVSEPEQAVARSLARVRRLDEAEIRLQMQLQGVKVHRTDLDPMVSALRAEVASVKQEREEVSRRFCGNVSESEYASMLAGWDSIQQDLNQSRDLLMSLRAKRDLFAIRAEQPSGNLAVIRKPYLPMAIAGPSRRRAIAIGILAATGLSLLTCVIADQVSRASREHESGELMVMVRRSISPSSLIRGKELT